MQSRFPYALLGLLAVGCVNTSAPKADLQGTWAVEFTIPGPSLVLNLSQSGETITGSGTYAIEAGGSGTLQVGGSYARPAMTLVLQYDNGLKLTYKGILVDSQHMTGTMTSSAGGEFTQTLVRR